MRRRGRRREGQARAAVDASLGRPFAWLWAAFAVSTAGTWVAFDAFPLIAILALHASPAQVSALAAASVAVGAVVAVPLGPWVERRRKRGVLIGMDLLRFCALLTVPVAYAAGALTFEQLLVVSVVVAAADIAFRAASGAYLKSVVRGEHLLTANARFESTTWTATAIGPPLGGAAIGLLGPVVTVVANAVSFALSAAGIGAIREREHRPQPVATRLSRADLVAGWQTILRHPTLRPLFYNTVLVNSLIMASAPLVAVLMLGDLDFAPWQYGLAFGLPCLGGLIGSRIARRLVVRHGVDRVLLTAGMLRAPWSLWLAFVVPGVPGVVLVVVTQLALITSIGVFNPLLATYRLEHTPSEVLARTLTAWNVTSKLATATTTAAWGLLASVTGVRTAIAAAGVLLLATPALLPRSCGRGLTPRDAATTVERPPLRQEQHVREGVRPGRLQGDHA